MGFAGGAVREHLTIFLYFTLCRRSINTHPNSLSKQPVPGVNFSHPNISERMVGTGGGGTFSNEVVGIRKELSVKVPKCFGLAFHRFMLEVAAVFANLGSTCLETMHRPQKKFHMFGP